MSKKVDASGNKLSSISEFSALSRILTGALILATLCSLALYTWMAIPPGKVYRLDDQAGIFSSEESEEMLSLMQTISREKDINVMAVTVKDKGPDYRSQDESESIRYAQDRFKELSRFETLRDNSGVLIFLELDGDYRFFYIVTFGTAKASVTNAECDAIYREQIALLVDGDYQNAIRNSLNEISGHNFTSGLLILTYATFIIAPFLIVIPIIRLLARRKRSEITVNAATYLDPDKSNMIDSKDVFESATYSESDYIEAETGWYVFWLIIRIILIILSGGRGGGSRGGGGSRFGGGGGGGGGSRFGGGGGRF